METPKHEGAEGRETGPRVSRLSHCAHCGKGMQPTRISMSSFQKEEELYQSHGTEQVLQPRGNMWGTRLHTTLVSIGQAGDRITEEADGQKSPISMETPPLSAELIEPKGDGETAQLQCSDLGMRKPPPKGGQKERREIEKVLDVSNLVCKLGAQVTVFTHVISSHVNLNMCQTRETLFTGSKIREMRSKNHPRFPPLYSS